MTGKVCSRSQPSTMDWGMRRLASGVAPTWWVSTSAAKVSWMSSFALSSLTLREPVRRFTLSRNPEDIRATADVAVRKEKNRQAVNGGRMPVQSVQKGEREADELHMHLERVQRLLRVQHCATKNINAAKRQASWQLDGMLYITSF